MYYFKPRNVMVTIVEDDGIEVTAKLPEKNVIMEREKLLIEYKNIHIDISLIEFKRDIFTNAEGENVYRFDNDYISIEVEVL